jgi:ABC-2 type transport system permease protein
MRKMIQAELLKTYRKWRTYIGFVAVGVLVPVVLIALKYEGKEMVDRMTRSLQGDFMLIGNLFNAYFVTQFLLNSMWVHIPFLITLVAGDQLAGEGTAGTFRVLLIRPASRSRILFTKYLTTLFYTFTVVGFLAAICLGLGLYLFGSGPLIVPGPTITIIAENELLWRMLMAFGLATVSMWCVASLAFLFSSLVENAIGPIIGTMAVIIVFLMIGNIPVESFKTFRPYLFTTYLNVWQEMLDDPIAWGTIGKDLLVLCGHCIGFYAATWYIFVRKDILS